MGRRTRHSQLQPALSSAGTHEWVLSWRLNEASDSSGDPRAVGSRFQVLGSYPAKPCWPVDVRVQGTRRTAETAERDWRRPSVDAVGTQRSSCVCIHQIWQQNLHVALITLMFFLYFISLYSSSNSIQIAHKKLLGQF